MDFLPAVKDSTGHFLISSLILPVLEKTMDSDFICPCQSGYNQYKCLLYALVPTVLCFFCVLNFADNKRVQQKCERSASHPGVSRRRTEQRQAQNEETNELEVRRESGTEQSPLSTGQAEEIESASTCKECLHALHVALIWLFLFFIDGRYVSCASSHWDGEYTESGALKWCKPAGNASVVYERLRETQRWIFISQCAGFGIGLVIAGILGLSYCCRSACLRRRCACYTCCNDCLDSCLARPSEQRGGN